MRITLRNFQEFATKRKRTVKMGLESLNRRSPQLWSVFAENLRNIKSLVQFKESVRKWDSTDCPSRLDKIYLPNNRFLLHITISNACL